MSRALLGRSVSIFVLIGVACVSAQVPKQDAVVNKQDAGNYQEQYFAGMLALKEGRYADARTFLQTAYDRARAVAGNEDWKGRTAFGLGLLARTTGDSATSERLQREAITYLEGDAEPSPLLGLVWNGLGEALLEEMKFEEAEDVTTKALRVLEREPRLKDWAFLCRRHLAEIRFMQHDLAGAEKILVSVIADQRLDATAPDLGAALADLGRLYTVQNRWKDAESLLREAVERNQVLGEQSPVLADTRVTLATLYRVEGHIERAEPLLRKSLKTYEAIGDPHAASAYVQLGWCAFAEHKYMMARDFLQKAIDVADQSSMPDVLLTKLKEELKVIGPSFATATKSRR